MNTNQQNADNEIMNKYIQKLIREQFNIGNMDLDNGKPKRNMNIFNKEYNHPYYYKVLDETITEDEINELDSLVGVAIPKDKDELRKIIEFYSEKYSKHSLNWLSVSGITDMSHLFEETRYNGDISKWNTSNVTDMQWMFAEAKNFNQPIGSWEVSNVTDMHCTFWHAHKFNQPIGKWDVSNVTDMNHMFNNAHKFNQSIGDWDVSNVTDMHDMFEYAKKFNQPIGDWDVSCVTNMSR